MTRLQIVLVLDVADEVISPELMVEAWRELLRSAVEGVQIVDVEATVLT